MSDAPDLASFDKTKAELFDALGHPIRIRILQALEDGPLGFSDLRRKVSLESGGHLQFHLGKLGGLVQASADSTYMLTDDGREALRIVGVRGTSSNLDGGEKDEGDKMLVSRWVLVGAVAAVIFLASVTGLVYLQLGGQITSLQSQVSSLKDEVYRYAYPVTFCQENGTAACNRALASVASQNPRFLSLENGTAYTYYMTSDENSHIINNAVMSHDLIFVANMTDLANTSAIWVRVPITGSTASYAGDYDLADATFTYYPPNQIVSIQF